MYRISDYEYSVIARSSRRAPAGMFAVSIKSNAGMVWSDAPVFFDSEDQAIHFIDNWVNSGELRASAEHLIDRMYNMIHEARISRQDIESDFVEAQTPYGKVKIQGWKGIQPAIPAPEPEEQPVARGLFHPLAATDESLVENENKKDVYFHVSKNPKLIPEIGREGFNVCKSLDILEDRINTTNNTNPYIYEIEVRNNLKPLVFDCDLMQWDAKSLAIALLSKIDNKDFPGFEGEITPDKIHFEGELNNEQISKLKEYANLKNGESTSVELSEIYKILKSFGYDYIQYINQGEGGGSELSYIFLPKDVNSCKLTSLDSISKKNINEAFEPWKADAWLNGERNENVARMNPDNMMAYNNYLDNVAYQALRAYDRVKAMKCVNLMRQILIAARNRGFDATAERINQIIEHRRSEIARAREIRDLNNQQEQPQERGGLFNPQPVEEDLGDESFGDFIGNMLDNNPFTFLNDYCRDYVRRNITMGNSAYDTYRYRFYKRRLLNKLEEINELSEKDKTLSWEELYKRYFVPYDLRQEIKKGNIEPYRKFYLLLRKDAPGCTGFIPSPEDFIKKEEPTDESLNEEVEIHDTLNPIIWNEDNTLKPEVAQKAKEIAQIFVDILTENGIKIKVTDIYLVGSNANYNYNEASDIDLHLIADPSLDCSDQHLKLIYDAYKTLFNRKYDISFKGINVEVYVEFDNRSISGGIYSIRNNKWIQEPDRNNIPEIDQEAVGQGLAEWTQRYEEITASPTIEEIDNYIDELYNLRINSFANEGEFGTGNLIFKEVRRNGILDNLKQLKTELENKQMSLESLIEEVMTTTGKIIL